MLRNINKLLLASFIIIYLYPNFSVFSWETKAYEIIINIFICLIIFWYFMWKYDFKKVSKYMFDNILILLLFHLYIPIVISIYFYFFKDIYLGIGLESFSKYIIIYPISAILFIPLWILFLLKRNSIFGIYTYVLFYVYIASPFLLLTWPNNYLDIPIIWGLFCIFPLIIYPLAYFEFFLKVYKQD